MSDITADDYFAIIPESVLYADITAQAVRLYCVLRRFADATGSAHPSRDTLAKKMGVKDPKVVDRAVKELERIGALVVVARWASREGRERPPSLVKGGEFTVRTSNGYHLKRGDGAAQTPRGVVAEKGEEPEPFEPETPTVADASPQTASLGFDEWYAQYPKKRGRQAAATAYKRATKKTSPDELLAGLARSVTHWQRKGTAVDYMPNPATWLNSEAWSDDYGDVRQQQEEESTVRVRDRWEYPSDVVGDSARERAYRASIGLGY